MSLERSAFIQDLAAGQSAFGLSLSAEQRDRLADHYELVIRHNPLLHLVSPGSAAEFATRHVLESLVLTGFLPVGAKFADIGSGGGFPAIPCLLFRNDLRAILIESKEKKAEFLQFAVDSLGIADRAAIVDRQFIEADPADADTVTCRALDKFSDKLPRMIKWAGNRGLLLFGGENLADRLAKQRVRFTRRLLPLSDRRFLFIVGRRDVPAA